MAWSKQAIARRSISSCGPLPLWIRTTEVSSGSARVAAGPPRASAQYAASRSLCCGWNPWLNAWLTISSAITRECHAPARRSRPAGRPRPHTRSACPQDARRLPQREVAAPSSPGNQAPRPRHRHVCRVSWAENDRLTNRRTSSPGTRTLASGRSTRAVPLTSGRASVGRMSGFERRCAAALHIGARGAPRRRATGRRCVDVVRGGLHERARLARPGSACRAGYRRAGRSRCRSRRGRGWPGTGGPPVRGNVERPACHRDRAVHRLPEQVTRRERGPGAGQVGGPDPGADRGHRGHDRLPSGIGRSAWTSR